MLDLLENIALALGIPFYYGVVSDLNLKADHVTAGVFLFHDGYCSAGLTKDAQGTFDRDYDIRLWVLSPSNLADRPDKSRNRFREQNIVVDKILDQLKEVADLSQLRVIEGAKLKLTDRVLDGINLTGKAKVEQIDLCQ